MENKVLDFDREIILLNEKIESLRAISEIDLSDKISALEKKRDQLTKKIYSKLTAWQVVQIARHVDRPQTFDYIPHIFDEFLELHGDRAFGDDRAIITGLGKINGIKVAFIGHQKGRELDERLEHNFGMPKPEGYRKALRVMKMAERFKIPVLTFIDTSGAYPGIEAEERQQSIAIAENLMEMSDLATPILSVVIGEGGSGGALAIGVCDRLLMLKYSVYSVISPEGCASILWKDGSKADKAAEILRLTARDLLELKIADELIDEPVGGAHMDKQGAATILKSAIIANLKQLNATSKASISANISRLLDERSRRLDFLHSVSTSSKPMIRKKK